MPYFARIGGVLYDVGLVVQVIDLKFGLRQEDGFPGLFVLLYDLEFCGKFLVGEDPPGLWGVRLVFCDLYLKGADGGHVVGYDGFYYHIGSIRQGDGL